jgi:Kef-type K+ transport system membrane component KefB
LGAVGIIVSLLFLHSALSLTLTLYSVSLVNASSSLTALWVLLATAGFALFILFPMKYFFIRLARHTGAMEEGQPSTFMMTVTLLLVFSSAFMTDILGVHPIFGGFLAGLVIPHEVRFFFIYYQIHLFVPTKSNMVLFL